MPTSSSVTQLTCGACQHSNSQEAQFCGGCGHGLYEACGVCSTLVTLDQKFCVACGMDLAAALAHRRKEQQKRLAEAIAAAKALDFERARDTLQRIAGLDDYRFAVLVKRAAAAVTKLSHWQHRVESDAAEKTRRAQACFDAGDRGGTVRWLEDVPEKLRDERARKLLRSCRAFVSQNAELRAALKQAFNVKDDVTAAGILTQLHELTPEDDKVRRLAGQINERLVNRARQFLSRHEYAAAAKVLSALPLPPQQESVTQLCQHVDRLVWLSETIPRQPYATPALGRLALRWAKEAPEDPSAKKTVEQLRAADKGKRMNSRETFAPWTATRRGWLGGDIGVLGRCQRFDFQIKSDKTFAPAPLAVALGLALQGLGRGRINTSLIGRPSVLAKFSRGKSKSAWGIDIGASALRAVRLTQPKFDADPVVDRVIEIVYDVPMCRGGDLAARPETIREAVAALRERTGTLSDPVCVNLPTRDSISRFTTLPPVPDKQADALIREEIRQRVPIPANELSVVTWRAAWEKDAARGRPLVIAASRKVTVMRRTELLAAAGLPVQMMQFDQVALANFAAFEFADVMHSRSAAPSRTPGPHSQDPPQPTVGLVDIGAAKTTLLLLSPVSLWFWTQESGGEDVTTATARISKTSAKEAERWKRNLAAVADPHRIDAGIEAEQAELRRRLERFAEEGRKAFPHFDVQSVWCVGAAAPQHGFLSRVLGAR